VAAVPKRVPPRAFAVVGAVPITLATLRHWLATIERPHSRQPLAPAARRRLLQHTVSFLIRAQWLLQESQAEQISQPLIQRLLAQRHTTSGDGLTPSDASFQARLDVIAEVLRERHERAPRIPPSQVAAYYATHRANFREPAVRKTLMIITTNHASAIAARTAITAGQPWAQVAKHYSDDSSALNGGAYNIVEGIAPPALTHAALKANHGQLIGPIKIPPSTEGSGYYLFKVTGQHPGAPEPLADATERITQLLIIQARQRAVTEAERSFKQRWRNHTLCAPRYIIPECSNYTNTPRPTQPHQPGRSH
jgi:parvulin-like peptidyl-prolyl isomerase